MLSDVDEMEIIGIHVMKIVLYYSLGSPAGE
jgi:hypothetical protein